MYKYQWYCRWCGFEYTPRKLTDRDGFCCTAHKQAHYRAYIKYVTAIKNYLRSGNDHETGVTQKKPAVIKAIARTTRDLGKMLAQKKAKK